MKIKKLIESECNAEFDGLTLLSKEEYFQFKENISEIDFWWWLRSPSDYSGYPSCAVVDGRLGRSFAYNTNGSVRPILIVKSSGLQIGDKFNFCKHSWTMITEAYALCDEPFCQMAFRSDWKAEDVNEYKASDIKKYLDSEWMNMKESEEDDTRRTN